MLDSSFNFDQFWDDFATPEGTQNEVQNRSKIRLRPQGVAQGPQPPGSHFGAFGEPFWNHFGTFSKQLWGSFSSLGVPDFQGRRVPALALTIGRETTRLRKTRAIREAPPDHRKRERFP